MSLKPFEGAFPTIHPDAYLAENATLIGSVTMAAGSSVWYGAVLRGDYAPIFIGENSCVEDGAILHGDVTLGKNCVIGHGAILHSCTVEDGCLIGMRATVLNGCVIAEGATVAAGSLVHHKLKIPAGSMVMGSPAVVVRPLCSDEQEKTVHDAVEYIEFAQKQLIRFGDMEK